ncbi:hypothetical protein KPL26_03085 [Clostridium algidicarnis]|uniref:hypothetical protein n=1 Tax=Clostridium algidicarnis TaxID=37659 RepID=UPI001C0D140C|nr:hypothetical protein [Clostridium algidicarnis]MBU3195648.1 hypothetical protein [Clostridium algidicarnis]
MSDGCKIDMKGLEENMKKLKQFTPKLKAALALDAQNIALQMEKWAKENVVWTDRTAHARLFLRSTVTWKNSNELMIAISHHVDYGVYLELCNEGKYAILEKAIQEYVPQFQKGWKKIVQSVGVI